MPVAYDAYIAYHFVPPSDPAGCAYVMVRRHMEVTKDTSIYKQLYEQWTLMPSLSLAHISTANYCL